MNRNIYKIFILFFYFLSIGVSSESWQLPTSNEVSQIILEPQNEGDNKYYTPESLLASLPYLRRANIGKSFGFGKVWLWQRGTIQLKSGNSIRWRAFTDNIILMESDEGPVFFTDIQSQTNDYADGKIIRNVSTPQGSKEIVIIIDDIE